MRSSRGMGAISSSKMPKKRTITRTDNPDEVSMYKKGGSVKCYNEGSLVGVGEDVDGGSAGLGNNGLPAVNVKSRANNQASLVGVGEDEDSGSAGLGNNGLPASSPADSNTAKQNKYNELKSFLDSRANGRTGRTLSNAEALAHIQKQKDRHIQKVLQGKKKGGMIKGKKSK